MILSHQLPNKPAFDSIRPSEFEWGISNEAICKSIQKTMDGGNVYQVQSVSENNNKFLLHIDINGYATFLKKILKVDVDRHINANDIACYLETNGIKTSVILNGYPKILNQHDMLIGYEYIPYRFAKASFDDIQVIGSTLAKIHDSLLYYHQKMTIKRRAKNRIQTLKSRASHILKTEFSDLKYQKLRNILCEDFNLLDVFNITEYSQPIHGDINYGNIIFSKKNNQVFFLDFEDTGISYFSPKLDLALLLERFILNTSLDNEAVIALGKTFLKSYSMARTGKNYRSEYSFTNILRALSIRSLLILSELEYHKIKVNNSEWEKFYNLYHCACENMALIDEIEEGFDG